MSDEVPLLRAQRLVTEMAALQKELNKIAFLTKSVVMTPERIKALEIILVYDAASVEDRVRAKRAIRVMLDEVKP